jgi:transposase-like protein
LVCLRCRKRARVKIHELVRRYCGAETIRVARVKCTECGRTFRVLPEFVVPYKSHSAAQVGKAISVCQQNGSKHEAAKTVGVEVRQVRRWVKWWQIVEAVIKASGLKQIQYDEGWLEQMLRIFRNWKRATVCET